MDKSLLKFTDFFQAACFFETSLIFVALFLGWIVDINPFKMIFFSTSAFFYGAIGTVPLFLMFLGLEQLQQESIVNIRKFLLKTLGPGLHRYQWTHLLLLASIAGLSEELVFRGVLQPWLESHWGTAIGLLGSNVVFGLVHAVTPLYALLAGIVGLYLGLSMDYSGDRNLLTPIIIHGFYDFLAFMALMRAYRNSLSTHN
jgi:membrane protease YdiL (CAAX protease family)